MPTSLRQQTKAINRQTDQIRTARQTLEAELAGLRALPATWEMKCFKLADEAFIGVEHLYTTDGINNLSDLIQQTVEKYLADLARNYDGSDSMAGVEFPFAENH